MGALFITGAGTGIGKTFVTTLLARQLAAKGRAVRALKPVMTGAADVTSGDSDAALILRALGREVSPGEVERISPWRYAAPLSPDMAAMREGADIDFAALVAFCRDQAGAAARDGADLLIEGIGGVMVPLTARETVADWIVALGVPAVLVTGSYLGSLSHGLTALAAMTAWGIAPGAIVVSESADGAVPLDETVETLRRFAGGVAVLAVPRAADGAARAPDLTGLVD